jgi:hypothetical protein
MQCIHNIKFFVEFEFACSYEVLFLQSLNFMEEYYNSDVVAKEDHKIWASECNQVGQFQGTLASPLFQLASYSTQLYKILWIS